MNTSEQNKYVQIFLKTCRKKLGKIVSIVGKNGASDLRHYPNAAGIEFGPIGAGPHSDNEWVDIKSLNLFYEILKDFLLCLNK